MGVAQAGQGLYEDLTAQRYLPHWLGAGREANAARGDQTSSQAWLAMIVVGGRDAATAARNVTRPDRNIYLVCSHENCSDAITSARKRQRQRNSPRKKALDEDLRSKKNKENVVAGQRRGAAKRINYCLVEVADPCINY